MQIARTVRFPRFGLPESMRLNIRLGQINASANLVPGNTYTFAYSIGPSDAVSLGPDSANPLSEDDVVNALAAWSPFANGYLGFSDISLTPSTLTLSILANAGSQNLTQGNTAQAIAQTLNSPSQPQPLFDWNFSLIGVGAAGLQTPTSAQEYANQLGTTPTPTITDSVKALLGTGPAIPGTPSAPWYVYVAAALAIGGLVYTSVK